MDFDLKITIKACGAQLCVVAALFFMPQPIYALPMDRYVCELKTNVALVKGNIHDLLKMESFAGWDKAFDSKSEQERK